MENFEVFDAESARELANSTIKGEMNDVLTEIRDQALRGKYVLHMSRPLKKLTVESLRAQGFKVSEESSIAIQKDNLYHTISWE
jgi:hypothetical protein